MRFTAVVLLALLAMWGATALAACGGSAHDDHPQADVPETGVAVIAKEAGVYETSAPGPLTPTARCGTPRAPTGTWAPPPSAAGPNGDGGPTNDAGDAGALGDSGADAVASFPAPPPTVVNSGGPVLDFPRWVPIFFQDTPDQPDYEDMLGSIGCTDYWRAIASDYGIGDGVSGPSTVVAEDAPTDTDEIGIAKWLAKLVKTGGVEAATKNTVYVIFYPSSTKITLGNDRSCFGFGGFHSEAGLADGTTVSFAVIPRCGGLERTTATVSHELIEAATDPFPYSDPAFQLPGPDDIAWAYAGGGEVSDLCTLREDSDGVIGDYPYVVQRSFSNRASFEGHDPCVPASNPYFYGAPHFSDQIDTDLGEVGRGVRVAPGTTRTIPVTLGADQSIGSFKVDVLTGRAINVEDGSSTFALDAEFGVPGQQINLSITSPSNAVGTEVFAIQSTYKGRRLLFYGLVGH
jgi:hypothetical protein